MKRFTFSENNENNITLIECNLETGRTHQIRVHLDHISHPVLGDPLYGHGYKTRVNKLKSTIKILVEKQTTIKIVGSDKQLVGVVSSKIKALRKYIKKLSFTHGYRSNFSLGNYTTNLNGRWDDNGNAIETDIAGNYISQKQIMTLNILEQFSPLIGMDLTLANNLSLKLEIKKDRNEYIKRYSDGSFKNAGIMLNGKVFESQVLSLIHI